MKPIRKKNVTSNDEKDGPPTSCYHLSNLGHTLNGIYLVKKKDYFKMEAVFCNFQPPDGSHNRDLIQST